MPNAATADTAHRWATNRAIDLWVLFEGDLDAATLAVIHGQLAEIRADAARAAVIAPSGCEPTSGDASVADLIVAGPRPPSPFGVFTALEAVGLSDVRRVGILGASVPALEAGHHAGVGAIVGLAAADSDARRALLGGEPDVIVEAGRLGAVVADRWGSGRRRRELVLLNPGPSVTSERVHRAIGGPDLCHREPEYVELFASVRTKLLRVAGVDDEWGVVLIGGSGTAALEAMTGAFVRPGRRLLVCQNGHYGERIATIASRLGVDVVAVNASHTEPIDPAEVARALEANPGVDAVAVVHHETTTGLLNPVQEIAAVADSHGVLLLTDAISSFGAEQLDLDGRGIDVVAGTSNKCLHGLPGVAFLLVSPRAQARADQAPARSLYFDIPSYLRAQDRRTVPFTPAIPAIYALDAALDELFDEGLEPRREHYRARMAYLDREFERLGFTPVVAAEHRSASVRSLPLPSGVRYEDLHDALKARGYVIYAGLGEAAATSFRVCALGNLEIGALQGFIGSLEGLLVGSVLPTNP